MNVTPDELVPGPTPGSFQHTTVMLDEVVRAISPRDGGVYVDATVGGGGHSAAILEASAGARLVAFDRDPRAVAAAKERLARFGERVTVVHARFSEIETWLASSGIREVHGLVADLGVSSPQLDEAGRGMSFRAEGPLDMRMDPTEGETALELIAGLDADELANVLYELGEERRSRRIARCILQALEAGELHTTLDLRRAVVRAVGPARVGGVDPATRTFQALRIAVNHELDELRALLDAAPRVLAPGGVLAVISFHSLEDRIVKRALLDGSKWERETKKPMVPSEPEMDANPRARSAKLRVARRLGA
jgi:16S rRNA (cytosine1402-N4)-methyltransferase